jgi:membrane-bound lytic murein transglycosylase
LSFLSSAIVDDGLIQRKNYNMEKMNRWWREKFRRKEFFFFI